MSTRISTAPARAGTEAERRPEATPASMTAPMTPARSTEPPGRTRTTRPVNTNIWSKHIFAQFAFDAFNIVF